jgi:iron complex outermembrane recepter protein
LSNFNYRRGLLATTMIGSAVLAMAATPSFAQSTPQSTPDEDATASVEDIVVTGSRIRVRDTTGSSPIVTISSEALRESGSGTIETYLNSLPQLSPNLTKTNNNPTGGGAAFLDLRQLGSNRGLILVDGHRTIPGASSGAVDISILPPGLIERVEIITGGASATYGSDAVTGVVNFILKDDFEGLEMSAQYGISEQEDGRETQLNLIAGGAFAEGRGHATFAASYNKRDSIGQAERDFSQRAQYCDLSGCSPNGSTTTGDGTFNIPNSAQAITAFQSYFSGVAPAAAIFAGQRLGFNPDGSLFVAGTTSATGAAAGVYGYTGPNTDGWDPDSFFGYNFNPTNLIQSPLERYNFYTSVDYDITDRIEFYGNALFSNYTSSNALAESPASFTIPVATTTTLPAEARAALTAAGITSFSLARRTNELGPRSYNFDTTAYQLTGGLRGALPAFTAGGNEWNYDIFASYGRYEQDYEYGGFPEANRIRAALAGCPAGSPTGPVGSAGSPTKCVPLNPFGANSITQAQAEYITAKGQFGSTIIDQTNVVAAVNGELYTLPAGPIGVAFGLEYRDLGYTDVPPEGTQTGTLLGGNAAGPVDGGYSVTEAFAEIRVPILADLPFANYLGLEAAYRASEYSLDGTGTTDTWKYGGEYAPFEWIRFRALKQQAVRAPSLGELYSTRSEGYPSTNPNGSADPCSLTNRTGNANAAQILALCQAQSSAITAGFQSSGSQLRTFSGGNTNLRPETAQTLTVGAVIKSPSAWANWTQSFSATIDYFKIEIEDVISSVGASTSLARCYDPTYNPTFSPTYSLCQNIVRDAETGLITNAGQNGYVSQTGANLAAYEAAGVDVGLAYTLDFSDYGLSDAWGRLGLSVQGTWYDYQRSQSLPGEDFGQNYVGYVFDGTPGGTTLPEYKFTTRLSWQVSDFSASLRWNYIDAVDDYYAEEGDIAGVEAYNYFYLNGSWSVNDNFTVYGGVDNLFDKEPPIYSSGFQYNTDPSTYDVIGRYFYVGVRANF